MIHRLFLSPSNIARFTPKPFYYIHLSKKKEREANKGVAGEKKSTTTSTTFSGTGIYVGTSHTQGISRRDQSGTSYLPAFSCSPPLPIWHYLSSGGLPDRAVFAIAFRYGRGLLTNRARGPNSNRLSALHDAIHDQAHRTPCWDVAVWAELVVVHKAGTHVLPTRSSGVAVG